MRKRFRRKGRKTSSYSTRSTGASGAFTHRGRKLSKRSWRNALWRQTLVRPHYKSINASLTTFNTPVAITDVTAGMLPCLPVGGTKSDLAFWKVNTSINQNVQFYQIETAGTSLSNWAGLGNDDPVECIIRGGRYYININCNSTNDPVNVRVQLAFSKTSRRTPGGTTGNTQESWVGTVDSFSPKPLTWTYDTQPDYSEYFHPPVLDRVFRLLPGEDMSIVKSIKPVRIHCHQHRDQGGWYPYWFVYCSQSATNVAGVATVGFVTGYNLSFSVVEVDSAVI